MCNNSILHFSRGEYCSIDARIQYIWRNSRSMLRSQQNNIWCHPKRKSENFHFSLRFFPSSHGSCVNSIMIWVTPHRFVCVCVRHLLLDHHHQTATNIYFSFPFPFLCSQIYFKSVFWSRIPSYSAIELFLTAINLFSTDTKRGIFQFPGHGDTSGMTRTRILTLKRLQSAGLGHFTRIYWPNSKTFGHNSKRLK